jgi:hypothetical protein
MAEFKKLSDVEVVAEPTESTNVLIEEDGVIKKAPKTAVGGDVFKKLSDVEVVETPADTANVLIEEDGVIKKAPKTAVGGTGGEEPDLIVTLTGSISNSTILSRLSITQGSISAITNKFQLNKHPIVKIKHEYGVYGDYYYLKNEFDAAVMTYGDSYWFVALIGDPGGPRLWKIGFGIDSDNNFTWASAETLQTTAS